MIVPPFDPTTGVPIHLPANVVALAASVVALGVEEFAVIPSRRGACYVCRAPARVAIHDADLRHSDDALAELCADCVVTALRAIDAG